MSGAELSSAESAAPKWPFPQKQTCSHLLVFVIEMNYDISEGYFDEDNSLYLTKCCENVSIVEDSN